MDWLILLLAIACLMLGALLGGVLALPLLLLGYGGIGYFILNSFIWKTPRKPPEGDR